MTGDDAQRKDLIPNGTNGLFLDREEPGSSGTHQSVLSEREHDQIRWEIALRYMLMDVIMAKWR